MRVHSQVPLHLHIVLEDLHVSRIGQHEEVTALAEVDLLPKLLLEMLEHAQTLDRKPDIDGRAELIANTAGATSCGARAEEGFAFKEHDVLEAAKSEMIGGAGTHHAAADDDDIRCCRN